LKVYYHEIYGAGTGLRRYLESRGQGYVLRVASNFTLTLAGGTAVTCAQAVKTLLKDKRSGEVRSAGQGSKGQRWYAWAWIGAASPRHCLLIRRHLKTGELAFHSAACASVSLPFAPPAPWKPVPPARHQRRT
jgi:hypothetical protein